MRGSRVKGPLHRTDTVDRDITGTDRALWVTINDRKFEGVSREGRHPNFRGVNRGAHYRRKLLLLKRLGREDRVPNDACPFES